MSKDYTLQYFNNESPGTGTVRINGEGYYIGSVTKTFEILEDGPEKKSIADCDIILDNDRPVYTGKEITPEISVKDGMSLLQEGTDYTLTYETAIDVGTYAITVNGISEYVDSQSIYFKIIPADPVLTFEASQIEKTTEDEEFINLLTAVTDGVRRFL